jgi:DNA-binding CsgD family transcriptional regulator
VSVVPDRSVTPRDKRLADLAETINREHELVAQAVADAVVHAIAAGEALLAAKALVPYGQWEAWWKTNTNHTAWTSRLYVRLAENKDEVLRSGATSVAAARKHLVGTAAVTLAGAVGHRERQAEAERLRNDGKTYQEIGGVLGVSTATVRMMLNSEYAENHRRRNRESAKRRRAALKALEERERQQHLMKTVRKAGGAMAEMYSMAERMQDVLAQAHRETENREARAALAAAGEHYRKMRDEIVRALGIS